MAATLVVDIIANATKAVAGLKDVDKAAGQAGDSTKKASSAFGKVAGAVATGFAVGKILQFGKASVTAAQESETSGKRLENIYRSMGDATGELAKHAENYATKLSNQTGIDDEAIQNAESLIATFKNVSDASAVSAGVFDRTTQAAADLAAAGFGTMESNATSLGKALNDPAKGMAKLARQGVTFTAAQQKQIAAMQKSGDLLGAQKVMLGAIETQVGGTAAATGTAAQKQATAYENMQEAIGAKLLPTINKLRGMLLGLVNFVSANAGWLTPVVIGLGAFAVAILVVTKAIAAYNIISQLWTKGTMANTAAQWLLNTAIFSSPIFWIIAGIVALVAIIVILAIKCQWFRNIFIAMWNGILTAAQAVWNWIKSNWPLLLAILAGPFGVVVLLIVKNWNTITAVFASAFRTIAGILGAIGGALASVPGRIASAFSGIFRIITWPFQQAFSWLSGAARAAWDWALDVAGAIAGGLAGVFDAITSPFKRAWDWVQSNIIGPIRNVWNGIANTINGIKISVTVPSWVPGLGGKGWTWTPPHIPTFHSGGYVPRDTMAYLQRGEVVIPRGGAGNVTVNVNVPVTANPAEVGRQVIRALRAYTRANGPIPAELIP